MLLGLNIAGALLALVGPWLGSGWFGFVIAIVSAICQYHHSGAFSLIVEPGDWKPVGNEFEYLVPTSQHCRGSCPVTFFYVATANGYAHAIPDVRVDPDGSVRLAVANPVAGKLVIV